MLYQREKVRLSALMNLASSGTPSTGRLLLGHPTYWGCQLLGWGAVWASSLLHILAEPPKEAEPLSLLFGIFLFVGLASFSHLYRIFIHLNHWSDLDWRSLLPRALLASTVIALTHASLIGLIHFAYFPGSGLDQSPPGVHSIFLGIGDFFLITAWSAVYFGYHFQVNFQKLQVDQLRLQVALREAEHRALSAQINPHFFFNSLNTVKSLISENPEKAREAITQLARLFRASLKTSRQNLVTLREEMDTVRSYLSLEQSRFEDRLTILDDVPEDVLESKLPPFLLQTLIENAIKYGVGDRPHAEISYRAFLNSDGLNLRVVNPGDILSPQRPSSSLQESTTGVGLENSKLRLHLLFGPKAFLHLTPTHDHKVQAEVLIPQTKVAP